MNNTEPTQIQLLEELASLRLRVVQFERDKAEHMLSEARQQERIDRKRVEEDYRQQLALEKYTRIATSEAFHGRSPFISSYMGLYWP